MKKDKINQKVHIVQQQDLAALNYPEIIKKQYDYLYFMIQKEEYYGALYQIKDVFELLLKMPVIIVLFGMESYIRQEDVEYKDLLKNRNYEDSLEVFTELINSGYSLGAWENVANGLKKCDIDEIPVEARHKKIYKSALDIIKAIMPIYSKSNNLGTSVTTWRNDDIGHGAVKLDVEEVKKALIPLQQTLNAMIISADYKKLHVETCGEEFIVACSDDLDTKITLNPYISAFANLFESYYKYQHRVKTINYINGEKTIDGELTKLYHQLTTKMNLTEFEERSLEDDHISLHDAKISSLYGPQKYVPVDPFYNFVSHMLNNRCAIALIEAERGMGKTVFSRRFMDSNVKILEKEVLKLLPEGERKGDEATALFVFSYNFNSSWKGRKDIFFERLHEFFKQNTESDVNLSRAYDKLKEAINADKEEAKERFNLYIKAGYNALSESAVDAYRVKILLLLDGVDELCERFLNGSSDTLNLGRLLDANNLPKNTYIAMLSRTENEFKLPEEFYKESLNQRFILNRTSNEYKKVLNDYIERTFLARDKDLKIYEKTILKFADYRMVYLDMLFRIYNIDSIAFVNRFQQGIEAGNIMKIYLDSIKLISKKYKEKLEKAMCLFSKLDESVSLAAINYIVNDTYSPDFRIMALVNDIRGFLKVDRNTYMKELYSFSNQEWRHEFRILSDAERITDDFNKEILRRGNNLLQHISVYPEETISDGDLLLISLMNNIDSADASICSHVLKQVIDDIQTSNGEYAVFNQDKYLRILKLINNSERNVKNNLKLRLQILYLEYLMQKNTIDVDKQELRINEIKEIVYDELNLDNCKDIELVKLYVYILYESAVLYNNRFEYCSAFVDIDTAAVLMLQTDARCFDIDFVFNLINLRTSIRNVDDPTLPYENSVREQIYKEHSVNDFCSMISSNNVLETKSAYYYDRNIFKVLFDFYALKAKIEELVNSYEEKQQKIACTLCRPVFDDETEEEKRAKVEQRAELENELISFLNTNLISLENSVHEIVKEFSCKYESSNNKQKILKLEYLRNILDYWSLCKEIAVYEDRLVFNGNRESTWAIKNILVALETFNFSMLDKYAFAFCEYLSEILDKTKGNAIDSSEKSRLLKFCCVLLSEWSTQSYNPKLFASFCKLFDTYCIVSSTDEIDLKLNYENFGNLILNNKWNIISQKPTYEMWYVVMAVERIANIIKEVNISMSRKLYEFALALIKLLPKATIISTVESYTNVIKYYEAIGNDSACKSIIEKCDKKMLRYVCIEGLNLNEVESDDSESNAINEFAQGTYQDICRIERDIKNNINMMTIFAAWGNSDYLRISYKNVLSLLKKENCLTIYKIEKMIAALNELNFCAEKRGLLISYIRLLHKANHLSSENIIFKQEICECIKLIKIYLPQYYEKNCDTLVKLLERVTTNCDSIKVCKDRNKLFTTKNCSDAIEQGMKLVDLLFNRQITEKERLELELGNELIAKMKMNISFITWYDDQINNQKV